MARYISPNLRRVHFVGDKAFQFQDGMLELKDPKDIELLDNEIDQARIKGNNLLIEKIAEVEIISDDLGEADTLLKKAKGK